MMASVAASDGRQPGSTMNAWMPGPGRPQLTDGVVHVWRAELTIAVEDLGGSQAIAGWLSPAERARAERIFSPDRRRLWIASRAVLRALLGRYLHTDPRGLCFRTGKHGKPMLLDEQATMVAAPPVGPAAVAPLAFNLSHSGELALYAVSQAGSVGVDVEIARRPIDHVAIAARALGRVQARRLAGLEPERREREFLQAWTRKEAGLKCRGTGLGSVTTTATPRDVWIAGLEVGRRAAAAVALEHPPKDRRCWTWQH